MHVCHAYLDEKLVSKRRVVFELYELKGTIIMLEQHIHRTLSKLNRSLDNVSFNELVNETQHLASENHNHITCEGNLFPKLLALTANNHQEPLALFYNGNLENYSFVTLTQTPGDMLRFLDKHPYYKSKDYTITQLTPNTIFVEDNLY